MICLAACIYFIYVVYKKWDTSPVIVTFATRGTPIFDIPFPSVTVCPESKSVQSIFNYTRVLHMKGDGKNLSESEYCFIKKKFVLLYIFFSVIHNLIIYLYYATNETRISTRHTLVTNLHFQTIFSKLLIR